MAYTLQCICQHYVFDLIFLFVVLCDNLKEGVLIFSSHYFFPLWIRNSFIVAKGMYLLSTEEKITAGI